MNILKLSFVYSIILGLEYLVLTLCIGKRMHLWQQYPLEIALVLIAALLIGCLMLTGLSSLIFKWCGGMNKKSLRLLGLIALFWPLPYMLLASAFNYSRNGDLMQFAYNVLLPVLLLVVPTLVLICSYRKRMSHGS